MNVSAEVEIKSKYGMHSRPVAYLAKLASNFSSDIDVSLRERKANGKSILGLMTLAARRGEKLIINAKGPDSALAIKCIQDFMNSIVE